MEIKIKRVDNGYIIIYQIHLKHIQKIYSSFAEVVEEIRKILDVDYIEKQWEGKT